MSRSEVEVFSPMERGVFQNATHDQRLEKTEELDVSGRDHNVEVESVADNIKRNERRAVGRCAGKFGDGKEGVLIRRE